MADNNPNQITTNSFSGLVTFLKALAKPSYTLEDMVAMGWLIDARPGGLVLGRDDKADDIPMIMLSASKELVIIGYMQGGEFLLRRTAVDKNIGRIEQINEFKGDQNIVGTPLVISNNQFIYNTNIDDNIRTPGQLEGKFLLVNAGQFVVNRAATQEYYQELVEINISTPVNV